MSIREKWPWGSSQSSSELTKVCGLKEGWVGVTATSDSEGIRMHDHALNDKMNDCRAQTNPYHGQRHCQHEEEDANRLVLRPVITRTKTLYSDGCFFTVVW